MTNQDPRTKYHSDGFNKQKQEYPGVQNQMDLVPDCGEETYKGNNKLQGKRALITGGDSGIGRAAAIAFAREGADVAINYLQDEEEDALQVKELIEAAGQKAVLLPGDLRDEETTRKIVHDAAKQLGGLDTLVLNAGIQQFREDIKDYTHQDLLDTFTANVFAEVFMLQEADEYLQEGASIILTTSVQAFNPSEILMDYAMTKSCQVSLVKGMTGRYAEKGIRINGVAPGPVWTVLQVAGGQPQEKVEKFGLKSPLGRAGQPAELAATYVHLASDESSFTTGQIYGVTGGSPIN